MKPCINVSLNLEIIRAALIYKIQCCKVVIAEHKAMTTIGSVGRHPSWPVKTFPSAHFIRGNLFLFNPCC